MQCDGKNDCGDGFDERGCGEYRNSSFMNEKVWKMLVLNYLIFKCSIVVVENCILV